MSDAQVPVTVLTGFLGAGKTTLLNIILKQKHGMKIAVIENEFGEIGIDDQLVKQRFESSEEIFEMNNGCICCTVRGDLIRILHKLLRRQDRLDAIIIETTGLADPAPVVQTFFMDDFIKEKTRVDGILTVVDAKHILQHLNEEQKEGVGNESVEQVAFADKLLLNKTDLVDAAYLQTVKDKIRSINKYAEVVECQLAHKPEQFPLAAVLELRAFDLSRILEMDPAFLEESGHHHHSDVTSVGFEIAGEMDMDKLNEWLATLLRERGVDIFRMKGVMCIKGCDDKFVMQGVHMVFDGEPLTPWQEGEPRVSKLIFIGRKLDRSMLSSSFEKCLAA